MTQSDDHASQENLTPEQIRAASEFVSAVSRIVARVRQGRRENPTANRRRRKEFEQDVLLPKLQSATR